MATWRQQAILGSVPPEFSTPFDALEAGTSTILTVLGAVKTTLELVETFLIANADPALEALKAALQAIIDLLNDLVGAGFFAIEVDTIQHGEVVVEPKELAEIINAARSGQAQQVTAENISPIVTKVLNPEANIDKIIESFDDIGDLNRPVFSDDAEVGMITILGGTVSPADFLDILFSILQIFNIQEIRAVQQQVAKSVIAESVSFTLRDRVGEFQTQPNPEGISTTFNSAGEVISKETGQPVEFVYSDDLTAEVVEGQTSGARGYTIRQYRSNIEIRPQAWKIKTATAGLVFEGDLPIPNPDFVPGETIKGLTTGATAVISTGVDFAVQSVGPDWSPDIRVTLGTLFPELEEFVGQATTVLQNIIDSAQLPTQAITELIKFLDTKIQQVEALLALIQSLKELFNSAVSNTGIYTLYIRPETGGITRIKDELKGSFSNEGAPSEDLNLTLSASYLVGGTTATKLIELLAGILNIG